LQRQQVAEDSREFSSACGNDFGVEITNC
jgi:hypothetical protein